MVTSMSSPGGLISSASRTQGRSAIGTQGRHRHLGEVGQRRDHVVGQLDVALDPLRCSAFFSGVGLRALSR